MKSELPATLHDHASVGMAVRRPFWPRVRTWGLLALAMGGAACGHARPDGGLPQETTVLEVSAARYSGAPGDPLEAACRDWRLSERQVATFFQLSQRYDESPYGAFYQVPCAISGKLESEGATWDFVIGGGGTATWSRDGQERHFGCSAAACAPLVLLPTDAMDPE